MATNGTPGTTGPGPPQIEPSEAAAQQEHRTSVSVEPGGPETEFPRTEPGTTTAIIARRGGSASPEFSPTVIRKSIQANGASIQLNITVQLQHATCEEDKTPESGISPGQDQEPRDKDNLPVDVDKPDCACQCPKMASSEETEDDHCRAHTHGILSLMDFMQAEGHPCPPEPEPEAEAEEGDTFLRWMENVGDLLEAMTPDIGIITISHPKRGSRAASEDRDPPGGSPPSDEEN